MAKREPTEERNLDGYGASIIAWTQVRERLEEDAGISPTHWLATVRPDGRPHVMPVWVVWVDDAFCFVTGATTRKRKNLTRNAHCVITVASSGLDLVVEGQAKRVSEEARLQRIAEAYRSQGWQTTVRNGVFYADFGAPSAGPPPYEVYAVVPVTVFGLGTDEPYGATRFRFSPMTDEGQLVQNHATSSTMERGGS
ncbi:MAG: pyridoxamine 5'-phosphate oxidase family protein [Chloroflexota bacterium]|nr:pyridoxamine 5'-phosphate oxidase family protein [Chloroflexota bacterium]